MEPNPATGMLITKYSSYVSGLIVALFLTQLVAPSSREYLALVPGRTLPCVWNLVTAGFIESNIIKVAVEVVGLLVLARIIEPAYGSREFILYLFLVNFLTAVATFVVVYVVFASTRDAKLLYTEFSGFHGLLGGLFVAIKHVMKDYDVKLFNLVNFKVKYLPSIYLVIGIGLCVGLHYVEELTFLLFGTYFGWLYLRFFQTNPETGARGDTSDDFRFATFFPGFLHPVVDALAAVFSFVFRLKHSSTGAERLSTPSSKSLLGTDTADANRRRERGAKALEERLGLKKGQPGDDVESAAVVAATHKVPA